MPALSTADVFRYVIGTLRDFFHVGGPTGPGLKNNAGVMQVRNSDDSAFARLQVGTPTTDQDAVTKLYADTLEKPLIVKRQADCSASIPANTATRGFVVVTTAGSGAVIGDVLYDDGSAAGTMTILTAVEGRCIAITDALTGGTITFETDSLYVWDADGGSWLKIGDVGSVTGAVRVIRFAVGTATADSASQIPANARIVEARLVVGTVYNAGTTIRIGPVGGTAGLVLDSTTAPAEANPQKLGTYIKEQDVAWLGSAAAVRATVAGASSGASTAIVFYTSPNA